MSTEGSGASRAADELHNEDAFLVEDGLGLYVVCDGVRSRPAGEVAADLAIHSLEHFFAAAEHEEEISGDHLGDPEWLLLVERGVRHAMRAVLAAALEDPELEGMATTVTLLLAHRSRAVIGHVGDSRATLIRGGRAIGLTKQHEFAEELRDRDELEDEAAIPIDTFAVPMIPGDTFVLCTDGAERVVGDPAWVRSAGELSPRVLASRIASEAHRRDPDADATVVIVRVRGDRESAWLSLSKRPRNSRFGHALAFPEPAVVGEAPRRRARNEAKRSGH